MRLYVAEKSYMVEKGSRRPKTVLNPILKGQRGGGGRTIPPIVNIKSLKNGSGLKARINV